MAYLVPPSDAVSPRNSGVTVSFSADFLSHMGTVFALLGLNLMR